MPDYAAIIQARLAGGATEATSHVDVLVDDQAYSPLKEAWDAAKKRLALAATNVVTMQDRPQPKQRMNSPSPIAEAEEQLEAARAAEAEAKRALEACFLRLHIRAPRADESAEIGLKANGDVTAIYDEYFRRCIIRVTDTEGREVGLTPDQVAEWLKVAPTGERIKAVKAVDASVQPVDFPT